MHKVVPNGAIHLNPHAKQNGKAKQVELVLVLVLSNVIQMSILREGSKRDLTDISKLVQFFSTAG